MLASGHRVPNSRHQLPKCCLLDGKSPERQLIAQLPKARRNQMVERGIRGAAGKGMSSAVPGSIQFSAKRGRILKGPCVYRHVHEEGCSPLCRAICSNTSTMAFRDTSNIRQAYTPAFLARIFCSSCSLEYLEYALDLLRGDWFSLVMHGQHHTVIYGAYFDSDRCARSTVFHCVTHKIFHCPSHGV